MSSNTWQIQDAATHLREVVELAQSQGDQTILLDGRPAVKVVAIESPTAIRSEGTNGTATLHEVLQRCPAPEIFDHIEQSRTPPDFGSAIDLG